MGGRMRHCAVANHPYLSSWGNGQVGHWASAWTLDALTGRSWRGALWASCCFASGRDSSRWRLQAFDDRA